MIKLGTLGESTYIFGDLEVEATPVTCWLFVHWSIQDALRGRTQPVDLNLVCNFVAAATSEEDVIVEDLDGVDGEVEQVKALWGSASVLQIFNLFVDIF